MTTEPEKLANIEGLQNGKFRLFILGERSGDFTSLPVVNLSVKNISAAISGLLKSERAKVWEEAAKIVSDLGGAMNFEQVEDVDAFNNILETIHARAREEKP